MAWQSEMTTIVRHLINDTDISSPTFTNSRLETSILVAAQLMNNEVNFGKVYTISVDGCSLSPDPTVETKDNAFINLVSLRAGCIILGSEIKTAGANLISVSDGPSSINMSATLNGLKIVYEDIKERYENAKLQYQAGGNIGEAVLSPYSLRQQDRNYRSW
jgi:hypothetical protein